MGYVVDYAPFCTSTHRTALPIVFVLVPGSPVPKTVHVFDKNTVPTLDKFSCQNEDYFTLKESTINVLCAAGLGRFLCDQETRLTHESVGERVFYALRGPVHGCQAHPIAQGMLDNSRLDSVALWSGL